MNPLDIKYTNISQLQKLAETHGYDFDQAMRTQDCVLQLGLIERWLRTEKGIHVIVLPIRVSVEIIEYIFKIYYPDESNYSDYNSHVRYEDAFVEGLTSAIHQIV